MSKLKAIIILAMFLIAPLLSIGSIYTESYENSRTRATTYGSSWTQTTQEDFDAGTKENVETSTSPGDVKLVIPLGRYRKPITISNTGSALTDYSVLVTLDTASLISAGKMRSDGGDIRFTDSDETTRLGYWIESGINTASTKIWVKVPSIPASSTKTIYVYYGNPPAVSESNANNVFDWVGSGFPERTLSGTNHNPTISDISDTYWGDAGRDAFDGYGYTYLYSGSNIDGTSVQLNIKPPENSGSLFYSTSVSSRSFIIYKDMHKNQNNAETVLRTAILPVSDLDFYSVRVYGNLGSDSSTYTGTSSFSCGGVTYTYYYSYDNSAVGSGDPNIFYFAFASNAYSFSGRIYSTPDNWEELVKSVKGSLFILLAPSDNTLTDSNLANFFCNEITFFQQFAGKVWVYNSTQLLARKFVSPEPTISIGAEGTIPVDVYGTLTSSIKDTGISNTTLEWMNIKWTATTPTGSSIKFNTRTSADGSSWSAWSSDYTVSGSTITSPSNRYIQYRANLTTTDTASIPTLSDVTITYNRKAVSPTLTLPSNNSNVKTTTPTFKLYSNDDDLDSLNYKIELSRDNFSSVYRVYDSSLAGWSASSYPSGLSASYTVQDSDALTEGYYYWRAYANDSSGFSAASQTYCFGLDATAPSANVELLPEYINKTSFLVEWSGYDSVSGIKTYDIQYSNDSKNWFDWFTGINFTNATWSNTTDGNKVYFRARAMDRAGNLQGFSNKPDTSTTIDITPPFSKIETLSKYQNSEIIYLKWGGSDKTSGIENYKIYVAENGKGYELYLNTKSESALFKGLNGVKYSFYSVAIDKAGNIEDKSIADTETTIDFVSPVSSVDKLPEYQNKNKFTVSWKGKDEVSGILNYTIYCSEDGGNFSEWVKTENNSAEFDASHGHTYSFYSIAIDNAGNRERKIGAEATTFVDTISPVSSIAELPTYQTSKSFVVYWYGEDNGSGIEKYTIYYSETYRNQPTAIPNQPPLS
ncbi:MAG: DUF2341 domain-containing protein [Candidatus Thermoplasmatota archaeon]